MILFLFFILVFISLKRNFILSTFYSSTFYSLFSKRLSGNWWDFESFGKKSHHKLETFLSIQATAVPLVSLYRFHMLLALKWFKKIKVRETNYSRNECPSGCGQLAVHQLRGVDISDIITEIGSSTSGWSHRGRTGAAQGDKWWEPTGILVPPLSQGYIQDPEWMPEMLGNTKRCIYCFFYMYTPMIKLNV